MKKIVLLILMVLPLWGEGNSESNQMNTSIVATTSWTGALASLAGVENPVILAPFEMQHPSEYELTPSDIQKISGAEIIVYAGYEVMVGRIQETMGSSETQLIPIKTVNDYESISEAVTAISLVTGTEVEAKANLEKLRTTFNGAIESLKERGIYGKKVIVHTFQVPLARELGFVVVGTFGPQPLEPKQLGDLSKIECDFIIDNWHNPVGQSLVELTGAHRVSLINFPGKDGTLSLFDVLDYNLSQFTSPN